jgi:hypothetical protein
VRRYLGGFGPATASEIADWAGQEGRHVDLIRPIRNVFDVTPGGHGDWVPELGYGGAKPIVTCWRVGVSVSSLVDRAARYWM